MSGSYQGECSSSKSIPNQDNECFIFSFSPNYVSEFRSESQKNNKTKQSALFWSDFNPE